MKPNLRENQLVGKKLDIAPKADEIEVSVFGPGYGESILIHIGDNKWFIIDSCIEPISKEPAPLTYLNQINVDPTNSVKLVVATHWHDDHVRGLGEIFRTCKSAEFICSIALDSDEFLQLLSAYGVRTMMESSGIDELRKIIEILQKRNSKSKYKPPMFAVADRCLWRESLVKTGLGYNCSVHSLSPSDAAILAAKLDFQRLFPLEKKPKRRLMATTPNRTAVVLWVNIGAFNILLGSDLEESGNSNNGWTVIINSTSRPIGKASFFKIPHHGSKNSHHKDIWDKMLDSEPIAVLTPYEKGNKRLPAKEDVERICSLTNNAYATSVHRRKRTIKRDRTVEKTIRETVRNIRRLHTSTGQVRLRIKPLDEWRIELFGDALPLERFYAF